MIKKVSITFGVIIALLLGLYILPNFINIDENKKAYIEQEIENLIKFDINIKGKVVFSILPYPAIVLKNVDFRELSSTNDKQKQTFLNAKQIFISMSLMDIIKGDFKVDKIVIDGGYLNYSIYQSLGFVNLPLFLKGENFKSLIIKDGVLTQTDDTKDSKIRRIYDINMNFQTISDGNIIGNGDFKYLSNTIDDIDFSLNFLDKDNYDLKIDFDYINENNKIDNNINLVVKNGEYILNGTSELSSDNLYKFIPLIDGSLTIPNLPIFNEKLNIKTTIQTTPDAIVLSNGSFTSNESFATFSGIIPFTRDENNKIHIQRENMTFNFDFKNLKLEKILSLPKDIFSQSITQINGVKELIKLLSKANFKITAKNIFTKNNTTITNFQLDTSPIFENGNVDNIDIKKFEYFISKNKFSLKGKINNLLNNIGYNVSVDTNIPFIYKNKLFNQTKINEFRGNILYNKDIFNITNLMLKIGNNTIEGNIERTLNNNKPNYKVLIKSSNINSSFFTKDKIDLPYIISKLFVLKDINFTLTALIKSMTLGTDKYDLFKLNTTFSNDTLSVKRLTFINDGFSSNIKGDLVGITGSNGEFKDFNYIITADNLKGLTLPFVKNTFIDRLISNGVKKLNIRLNGDATNPNSNVYAELNNINVEVNGKLLEGSEKYTLNLSHNELKGFLFSWGIIDTSLMNYFYDDIPFSLTAQIDGNNINKITLKVKKNTITGDIIKTNVSRNKREPQYEITASFNIDNLDVKDIFKRLKTTDLYIDFLLKVIRTMPFNMTFSGENIIEYDGNIYKNINIDLKNAKNPGRFNFLLEKNNTKVSITSEILNNKIFNGTLDVNNYQLPNNIMNNEVMNLTSGILNIILNFKTNGMTFYDLTSNLSGDFDANIQNGTIKGISDYDTILLNLSQLANITTNNVIYILENSFKSGNMAFSNLSIKGNINNSNVEKSAFNLNANNMIVNGFISGNLIQKSLNIESVFDISNLSIDTLSLLYNLNGFINNLKGDLNTSTLTSKINTSYIHKKVKEINELLSNN